MDIYILRDGKEIGPLSEVTTHTLLNQGSILPTDLAWRPGMPKWIPLDSVLSPTSSSIEFLPPVAAVQAPILPAAIVVPATDRQKAFLRFMEIPFTEDLTKDRAAIMINDSMEDPRDAARVARWNNERLTLHPELFEAEIQAQKENRPNHFLQIAQTEGAEFFTKVTKAHCLVVIGHLDLQFPEWDAKPREATWNYFFPGIAEKFPQLVNKSAVGKFKYPERVKTSSKSPSNNVRQPAAAIAAHRPAANPMAAAFRGLLIGVIILGALFAANEYRKRKMAPKPDESASASKAPAGISTEPSKDLSKPAPKASGKKTADTPAASSIPNTAPSILPDAGADMAAQTTVPAPVEPAPAVPADPILAPPKTIVTITQPVKVTTPFGVVVIKPGTQVKIISRDAGNVSVRYLNNTVSVPVDFTDLGDAAIASPSEPMRGPAPAPAPVRPPAPVVAPPKPPTSLF